MKCIKCKKKSEYDSPEDFCLKHWVEWWHERDEFTSDNDRKRTVTNTMRRIRYREKHLHKVKSNIASLFKKK